ncbi:heavy metal translocating P-type ATPase [Piscicoccus intestinalis]|uniref:heavy metal translocating P-type ATPase n=1 Tax=Piscicoccus intestinalis TaxID=746033 RepID=UPI0008395279|nr:cation-translocating P-type ATPase [Piscicoccus intestinalis]
MSDACGCCAGERPDIDEPEDLPWWRDREVLVPAASGIALGAGLLAEWTGAGLVALGFFWVGLLLGGSTFVPGALRRLMRERRLGIGLLMTISATGAVLLGHVGEAAALAFLYSIAEALEEKAMDRARAGLRALLDLVPETATVVRDGATAQIPAADLRVGDLLLVRPGERVATDGVVREGRSALDASAITGESIPVEVAAGEPVPAGAINGSGSLRVEATAAGTDNSLTTIVQLVQQAQARKGARARLADRIARPLVPGVLVLALAVAIIGSLFGDPQLWITRALVVLVAASPCALAIAVPVTVVSAVGAASRFGVVITSGAAFERFGGIRHVALDKTGTLTRNEPTVARVVSGPSASPHSVISWAASLERHSTHPLAAAITAAAPQGPAAHSVCETAGEGITGELDGAAIAVGSPRRLAPGELSPQVDELEAEGMTVVVVHRDGAPVGAIGVRDELRPEAAEAVAALTERGLGVTMLTGDNTRTARALAAAAGIDDVRAQLRPQDKAEAVTLLGRERPTAMIGDGINDAPALGAADVGIAMGATGSDAAIESADIAFTGHDLRLIPQALDHARRGRRIIDQNVALSILLIAILPPLAIAGVLGLAAVVFVHEAAEVVIILNGLRAARARRSPLPAPASPGSARVPEPSR